MNAIKTKIDLFTQHLPLCNRALLQKFQKQVRSFTHFNLIFRLLLLFEFIGLVTLLYLDSRSSLLACSLGIFFLSSFSYLVLFFYLQAKRSHQIVSLQEEYLRSCRTLLSIPEGTAQHHLCLSEALSQLAHYLDDFAARGYTLPESLSFLRPLIAKFSLLCYQKDCFFLKTLLLTSSAEEHLKQIRRTPQDLELHASLATTFVALSKLYSNPIQKKKEDPFFKEKQELYCSLAVEELMILNDFAPNDPWVHEQLALNFHALGLYEKELAEYELLSDLRPHDLELRLQLGKCYFERGLNAKGLRIYEELKKASYEKREELLLLYRAFRYSNKSERDSQEG